MSHNFRQAQMTQDEKRANVREDISQGRGTIFTVTTAGRPEWVMVQKGPREGTLTLDIPFTLTRNDVVGLVICLEEYLVYMGDCAWDQTD